MDEEIWDGGVSLLLLLPLHKVYKHVVRWVIVVGVIGSTLSPEMKEEVQWNTELVEKAK